MEQATSPYVLEMKEITKSFPGVLALDKVSLSVRPGTVHVLCGENGAGKSTRMKVLSGEYEVDSGEIYFNGRKLEHQNTQETLKMGIAMIYQELSPVMDMTIAENIFLGREPTTGRGNFVDFKTLYAETQRFLDQMGLKYDPHMKMRDLSIAGQQLIEITKAISRNASLIIMDEPTSAITDREVEVLFKQIRDLKAKGVAIIYITHKMNEIFEIADDISVIRDGQHVASGPASDFTENKLISLMVGREITNIFPKLEATISDVALEARNLTRHGVFENISFQVRKGEIFGLAGLVGAGRTEVARVIFGLDPADSGEILIDGKPVRIRNTTDAIHNGIAMVSEDRKNEGLVLIRSCLENISLANLHKIAPGLFIDRAREKVLAEKMKEKLRIKVADLQVPVSTLSGGNQQKVVIAKWLIGELKVLILDEPPRGIDVGSKSEIHRLMSELAQQGLAIIMISSELPEILGMSDRVLVMHEGVATGEIAREDASQEAIMTLATGGKL
jgi:inositol transport system ATP-binding protein